MEERGDEEKESQHYYEEEERQRVSQLHSVVALFQQRPYKAITTLDGMGVLRKDGKIQKLPKDERGVLVWCPVWIKRKWNVNVKEAKELERQGLKTVGGAIYRPELLAQIMAANVSIFQSVKHIGSQQIDLSTDTISPEGIVHTKADKWAQAMLNWAQVSRPYRCLVHAAFEDSAMWKKDQCDQLLLPSGSANTIHLPAYLKESLFAK